MIEKKINEKKLVSRLKQLDEIAWKEFFALYSRSLTFISSKYIANQEDVKDTMQEFYVKMFYNINKFEYRGSGSLKAWVTKILVNTCINHIKRNSIHKNTIKEIDLTDIHNVEDYDTTEVTENDIMNMIQSLPKGYRTIFKLYVFEKKSHREIANILKIAENSSSSHFYKARIILARKINEYKKAKRSPSQ